MLSKKIWGMGLLHALGVSAYVALVALIMTNGEKWFGKTHGILAPIAILMLLTLSAAVVGSLIFIRPALWTLGGQKKEALALLLATLSWLGLLIITAFLALALWT